MPAAVPDTLANATALVLFSGGQDSTTCLAWALARFGRVETLGFDYGQRHAVELACRARIRERLAAGFADWAPRLGDDHTLALPSLGAISDTALTRVVDITTHPNGLPSTFVPGRNLLFLTYAGALAWRRGATRLVTGVCETDYSGYPDCRDDTVKSLQATLNLGMETRVVIHTPLMWRTKAQTWWLAERLGGPALVDIVRTDTHTCYLGDRTHRHPWGFGCGACPACQLRAAGWEEYQAQKAAPDADPARLAGMTE